MAGIDACFLTGHLWDLVQLHALNRKLQCLGLMLSRVSTARITC